MKITYQPLSTSGKYSYVLCMNPSGPRIVGQFAGPDGWDRAVRYARHLNRQSAPAAA